MTGEDKLLIARISMAYLHILLSFRLPSLSLSHLADQGISPDEIKSELGELVPFLVEPRSTVRHDTARQAWTSVWEFIGESPVRRLAEGSGPG